MSDVSHVMKNMVDGKMCGGSVVVVPLYREAESVFGEEAPKGCTSRRFSADEMTKQRISRPERGQTRLKWRQE